MRTIIPDADLITIPKLLEAGFEQGKLFIYNYPSLNISVRKSKGRNPFLWLFQTEGGKTQFASRMDQIIKYLETAKG